MDYSAVLIDGAFFEKLKLRFERPEMDLISFSDDLCSPLERFRTYYFDALPWMGEPASPADIERRKKKQRFLDGLRLLKRFEVRLGRVSKREIRCEKGPPHVEFTQKLVDVLLSVEMVRLAWSGQVRNIVLVGGDSDFVPAVTAAKEAGVIVKLVHSHRSGLYVHNEMLMACDERVDIDKTYLERFSVGQ